MKSINRIFGSFIIVCLAIVSCEKEKHPQSVDPEQPDVVVRTISVSFDTKSTRTELVGTQPKFKNNDLIKLAQVDGGAEPQVCTVRVENGVASVETTLEGKLKAVYPDDCADVSDKKITGIKVPASQDGTFAKAHICMAEQEKDDDESLKFYNQTPILRFYVDESIQVQSITISGISNPITVKPSSGYFTPSDLDGPDQRICYAAVPSGLNSDDFAFSSTTGTQGTVKQTLKAETSLANGTMYNIFIPYYIDLGDAGKWGYCNVGAFLPEEDGLYFAWGETTGHKPSNVDGQEFLNAYSGNTLGFAWKNCPFSDNKGDTFSKYITNSIFDQYYQMDGYYDNKTVLDLSDDAAYNNWGDAWRMPTVDEFVLLRTSTSTTVDDFNNTTGILTIKGTSLQFPASGYGSNKQLTNVHLYARYWSSSLNTSFEGFGCTQGYLFECYYSTISPSIEVKPENRYLGVPIRPIFAGGSSGGDDPKIDMNGTLGPIGKSDL